MKGGWGRNASFTSRAAKKYRLIFWKRNLAGLNIVFDLDCWQKERQRAHSGFEISSMFWTAVHLLLFFPACYAHLWMVRVIEGKIVPKRWSEGKPRLLRVRGWFELGRFRVTGSRLYVPILSILHARHRDYNELHFHALFTILPELGILTQILVKPGLNSMA